MGTIKRHPGNVRVQFNVPVSVCRDLLTSAVEAGHTYGIGYWAVEEGNELTNVRDENGNVAKLRFKFADAHSVEKAGGATSEIDHHDIARALGLALTVNDKGEYAAPGHAEAAAQWLSGNGDGPSADVIVQLAVFNDTVYG